MPDDDLLTLLLGCGCRKRCCCGAPDPAPAQAATPLFGQAPRTVPPPRLPDETPFIPPPPWYATGQRPSDFGNQHVPRNASDGRPLSRAGGDDTQRAFTLDDGRLRSLTDSYTVDHEARVIRPNDEITGIEETQTTAPGEYFVTGTRVWTFISGPGWRVPEPSTTMSSTFSRTYTISTNRVIPYATGVETSSTRTVKHTNQAKLIDFTYQDQEMISNSVAPVRPTELRFEVFKDSTGEVLFKLVGLVNRGLGTPNEEHPMGLGSWLIPIPTGRFSGGPDDARTAYPFTPNQIYNLPIGERTRSVPIQLVWAPLETGPRPELRSRGERWRGPGGAVTVQGYPTSDHAALVGTDILTCPAGSWSGPGSWAAYRRAAGGTVLLIEHADQVTRVDLPPGPDPPTAQSVPLAVFLAGLGITEWRGFGRAGPLHNTWPPHEATTRDSGSSAN
ncbi:hypothetical protein [Deinococcus sp.]|uniref:hypothetical protein n=1 Tax=Deinococcus sp. TaxID=47478 RepID=UPI0025BE866F|nr:hypothetical protein [Deinococcus sp.]